MSESPYACDCEVSTSGIRGMHHSTTCAIFKGRLLDTREPTRLDEVIAAEAAKIRADGKAVARFLQGILVGTVMKTGKQLIKVDHVETPTDTQGNYESHFVVETEAGHRIRVTVELE